jgi:predicted DNA-binding protein (UPF0251 family)
MDDLLNFIEDHTLREASIHFGVSESTISRKLRGLNVKRAGYGPGKITPGLAKHIRRLYNQDIYTQKEVADIFGISRKLVNEIINFKVHIDSDVGTQGTADVHFTIKAEECQSKIKTDQPSN